MKKYVLIFLILICLIFFAFWVKNNKSGNNNINQDEVKNIFNMQEYEAEIEVTVYSNKNENKYKIKQKYIKDNNKNIQEILEPNNLKGIKIVKDENKVTIENTKLNLTKIFEEFKQINQNDMDLEIFIRDFEENKEKNDIEEKNDQIILKTFSKNDNKYTKNKVLYIDKNTGKPIKMEITDTNKKTSVYIVYNKVEIK